MRLGRLALTAAALTLGLSNRAQSPQAPTLQVYSRETVVDITVTDSKGNPVHGLTQSDFTVKEDGKPQSIRSFHEYTTQPTPPPPKLPPNVYTNLQPPASGPAFIFLLDFVSSAPIHGLGHPFGPEDMSLASAAQRLVKQEATKYLATMPPGTRIAVLGMSKGLRILQGFTSDPVLLQAAVDSMQFNLEARAVTYKEFCDQTDMRNRMTLEVLNQIAADASTIKGKKNLLWFSVGVPSLNNPSRRPGCLPDYESDLSKTYGLLAASQTTVYPVDVRGIPPLPSYIPPPEIPKFYEEIAAEQLAMETWAEETGGEAYYNSNDLAGLIAKAVDKGANCYTISYVPPGQKYNWAHHSIKVEVDQPHLNLVYRESYDAVDPATIKPTPGLALADLPTSGPIDTKAAMGRAMPTSTNILFDVQVTPNTEPRKAADPPVLGTLDPKLKSKPLTRYSFVYVLPAKQIAFTDAPHAVHKGALEFDIAAYDGDGALVTGLSQTIKLPLSDSTWKQLIQGPFRFFQQLDLPPGPLFLRIGVLDPTANKLGTLEIPLTVPKNPTQHAAATPRPQNP